ncbi:hypothetical protein BGX34_006527, partial [Mortierella sp. NVP85]
MTGASIQEARGLTALNEQLLKQRGAVGEPEHLLGEPSRKLSSKEPKDSELKETSDVPLEQPKLS